MDYVLELEKIDQTQVGVVGEKAAHLGELSRIAGIRVPAGYCVTTAAFQRILAQAPGIEDRLDRLARLSPDDRVKEGLNQAATHVDVVVGSRDV